MKKKYCYSMFRYITMLFDLHVAGFIMFNPSSPSEVVCFFFQISSDLMNFVHCIKGVVIHDPCRLRNMRASDHISIFFLIFT